jgi:hypothetical protein
MHKIIIFRKKSEESRMIESAVKVINDQQDAKKPRRRLTKEEIIREIVSNSSMSNFEGEVMN